VLRWTLDKTHKSLLYFICRGRLWHRVLFCSGCKLQPPARRHASSQNLCTLPEIRAISRQPTARRHLFPHWSRRGESGGRTRPTPPRPACLRRIGQLAMSRRPPNFPPTTTSRIPAFPRPARTSLATSASVFTVPLRKELDRGRGGRIRRGERGTRKAGKGTGEQTDPGPPGQRLTWLALPPRRALPSETRSGIAQNPQLAREGKAWLRIVSRFRARQRPRRSGA
jgi:hypothetical protein